MPVIFLLSKRTVTGWTSFITVALLMTLFMRISFLTSLILRDDNAFFEAVERSLDNDLESGRQVWGIEEGVWSLAPFHVHDPYIKRELKEALQQQQEIVNTVDFSS